MAKLTGLMYKIQSLKQELAICNKAYTDLLNKYNKLYQKYSYIETMDRIKQIEEIRKLERKLIL